MEAETIDLTDPFEKYLKENNWTAEGLNERLSLLAGSNTNSSNHEHKNITLADLLGDTSIKKDLQGTSTLVPTETIVLSDSSSSSSDSEDDEQTPQKPSDSIQIIDICLSDDESYHKAETKNATVSEDVLSDLSDPEDDDLFDETDNKNEWAKTNEKPDTSSERTLPTEDVLSLNEDESESSSRSQDHKTGSQNIVDQPKTTDNISLNSDISGVLVLNYSQSIGTEDEPPNISLTSGSAEDIEEKPLIDAMEDKSFLRYAPECLTGTNAVAPQCQEILENLSGFNKALPPDKANSIIEETTTPEQCSEQSLSTDGSKSDSQTRQSHNSPQNFVGINMDAECDAADETSIAKEDPLEESNTESLSKEASSPLSHNLQENVDTVNMDKKCDSIEDTSKPEENLLKECTDKSLSEGGSDRFSPLANNLLESLSVTNIDKKCDFTEENSIAREDPLEESTSHLSRAEAEFNAPCPLFHDLQENVIRVNKDKKDGECDVTEETSIPKEDFTTQFLSPSSLSNLTDDEMDKDSEVIENSTPSKEKPLNELTTQCLEKYVIDSNTLSSQCQNVSQINAPTLAKETSISQKGVSEEFAQQLPIDNSEIVHQSHTSSLIASFTDKNEDSLLLELDEFIRECEPSQEGAIGNTSDTSEKDNKDLIPDNKSFHRSDQTVELKTKDIEVCKDRVIEKDEDFEREKINDKQFEISKQEAQRENLNVRDESGSNEAETNEDFKITSNLLEIAENTAKDDDKNDLLDLESPKTSEISADDNVQVIEKNSSINSFTKVEEPQNQCDIHLINAIKQTDIPNVPAVENNPLDLDKLNKGNNQEDSTCNETDNAEEEDCPISVKQRENEKISPQKIPGLDEDETRFIENAASKGDTSEPITKSCCSDIVQENALEQLDESSCSTANYSRNPDLIPQDTKHTTPSDVERDVNQKLDIRNDKQDENCFNTSHDSSAQLHSSDDVKIDSDKLSNRDLVIDHHAYKSREVNDSRHTPETNFVVQLNKEAITQETPLSEDIEAEGIKENKDFVNNEQLLESLSETCSTKNQLSVTQKSVTDAADECNKIASFKEAVHFITENFSSENNSLNELTKTGLVKEGYEDDPSLLVDSKESHITEVYTKDTVQSPPSDLKVTEQPARLDLQSKEFKNADHPAAFDNSSTKSKGSDGETFDLVEPAFTLKVLEDVALSSQSVPEATVSVEAQKSPVKCVSVNDRENLGADNDDNHINVEDIRQQLRLQLSNLRTKRKINIFQKAAPLIENDESQIEPKKSLCEPKAKTLSNSLNITNDKDMVATPSKALEVDQTSQPGPSGWKPKKTITITCEKTEVKACGSEEDSKTETKDDTIPEAFQELRKIIRKKKLAQQKHVSLDDKSSNENSNDSNTNEFPIPPVKPVASLDLPKNVEIKTKACTEEIGVAGSSGMTFSKQDTKSVNPFVSNTLDEFLTDAKLNVSYTIPKCDAEEGLQKDYFTAPVVPYQSEFKEESGKSKEEPKYKPKTLAEKRRLLEKKTRLDERRMKKQKAEEELQKRSYVLFKDKKVFIRSKTIGKCFAFVQSKVPRPVRDDIPSRTRKPSLLTELHKKEATPVKYRPGPLCKKYLLQQDYDQWSSELKPLPTVFLNVMPEFRKPVHPNLLPIVSQWNGEITDDQVEFALAALGDQPVQDIRVFQFDLRYASGQDNLLVRKRIPDDKAGLMTPPKDRKSPVKDASKLSVTEEVQKVMDDLLTYVEIKELAPTLIKEDEPREESYVALPPVTPSGNKTNHAKKKISKTNRELIRLSCRVVTMDVKESTEDKDCPKPHCKLGCVCMSLRGDSIITNLHCQKVKCIFGCLCPKEKSKIITIRQPTLSSSTDLELLSTDTVTRIEDEAKKNLAREEKEFTQTIICADNKTIVVGVANKPRRAARAPKKYSDFFAEEENLDEVRVKKKRRTIKPCVVELEKLNLSDIEPYCMVHHLYNCHCKGLAICLNENQQSTVKPTIIKPVKKPEEWLPKAKISPEKPESAFMESGRGRRDRKVKPQSTDFIFYGESQKQKVTETPHEESSEEIPNHCARTLPITKDYLSRREFNADMSVDDFIRNVTEADLLKLKVMDEDIMSDADVLKRSLIADQRAYLNSMVNNKKPHKRKQSLTKREDGSALQASARKDPKIKPVFKGEIIVNDFEWLKKITNKSWTTDAYARILPWPALLKGFTNKTINVYCISDVPLRLLLGVGKKVSNIGRLLDIESRSKEIFEASLRSKVPWLVGQSENVRDIIKWLHAGSLIPKYKADTLSFLLVESVANHFEVRGLCTQKAIATTPENKQVAKFPGLDDLNAVEDITEIKHKDFKNEINFLFVLKCQFKLRELVEDGFDDDHTDSLYMWVGLPEVFKVAKWRMIFLKDDFVYLFFNKIKYSIKYEDLVKLTEIAKESKNTLIIRNLAIRRSYTHNMYGIYVSPKYSDRIFVGPYFVNHFEEDVSTLKYMQQSLISSETYNRMTGEGCSSCGHWMLERPYKQKPKRYLSETVDLTIEDELKNPPPKSKPRKKIAEMKQEAGSGHVSASTSTASSGTVVKSNNSTALDSSSTDMEMGGYSQMIIQNGQKVLIKTSKPRAPTEFNRFIITNIPHFGYLGAYQSKDSLEVSWPSEKKVLVFENADKARDFLQERFSQLLQPVPVTFKIQVIVLVQIDLSEYKPINAELLNGHCICGFFGTYNLRDLTDQFCRQEFNMSKAEISKLFMTRAEAYITRRIEDLAIISGIDKAGANYNVKNILEQTRDAIKQEETARINLSAQIHAKEAEVVANIKKMYEIMKLLPEHQRNIEARIVNDILKIRPHRLGSTETIVIADDDTPITSVAGVSILRVQAQAEKKPPSTVKKPVKEKTYKRKAPVTLKHSLPIKKIVNVKSVLGSGARVTISQPTATVTSQNSNNLPIVYNR